MNEQRIKRYEFWYKIFMIAGLLGVIDVLSHSIVKQNFEMSDMGFVSLGVLFLFSFVFGTTIAAIVAVVVSTILGFSVIWLLVAYFLKKKKRALENPTEENLKKLKRAKIIFWIVVALIVALTLYTVFVFVLSNV